MSLKLQPGIPEKEFHMHEHNALVQAPKKLFSGNIFIFYSFDVGDDINLETIKEKQLLIRQTFLLSKYFKNYHVPLAVELPHPHSSSKIVSTKVHEFGVISLVYKISFEDTLEDLRERMNSIEDEFREQSVIDAGSIFRKIKPYIKKSRFFHLRTSYMVVQVDPVPEIDVIQLKEEYGNLIVSILRFETETLSEYQKNDILATAIGYYRGDLIIIDAYSAFVYDDGYEDFLDIFEFANIQHLEMQYFDKLLDQKLQQAYQSPIKKLTFKSYLPLIGLLKNDPVSDLGNLKVDISVITERLESSIKLAEEPYFYELYTLLANKFDLNNWRDSIHRKLDIIKDIGTIYQNKVDSIREDLLSVLIIVLIFIELVVGILSYLK